MRWEEAGEGFPLILVHGIPTGPALWRRVVPRVHGARCLAWEMVGYGASIRAGRDRDISVARQADYMLAWMRALGLETALFAGHDLGGGVVQIAAVREPHRCSGLLLTNSIGYDSWPIPSVRAMRAAGPLLRHMPPGGLKQMLSVFYARGHDDREQQQQALDVHWPHYAAEDGAEAFVRQMRSLNVDDTLAVADGLPQLRVPARVVWGEADRFQKIEYGERLARDLNAPLTRVAGGKHFMPEDHPEEIARALNELVEEVTGAAPRGPVAEPLRESDDGRLRLGLEVFGRYGEVTADRACGTVAAIYEDIQSTLRVPFVNLLFRKLADDAAYLEAAWNYVRPIARTQGFENAADVLRRMASPPAPPRGVALPLDSEDIDRVRRFTDSIHDVLPKLHLIASMLDPAARSWNLTEEVSFDRDGTESRPGVPDDSERIAMVDVENAEEPLRRLFLRIRDVHGHPAVATYYRALGNWPDLLAEIWARLEPQIASRDYADRKNRLIAEAAAMAEILRDDDRPQPDGGNEISALLRVFRLRLIPDLLLDVSAIRAMLDGEIS